MPKTDKERKLKELKDLEEKRLLKEIEDSFCSAGYTILETTIEYLDKKLVKQA